MSNINHLVSDILSDDKVIQEAGILRGIGQGAIGTLGGPVGGIMSAASRAQRNEYEDKLRELKGLPPKGVTAGRVIGAAAAGALGSVPILGGLVNAYQGFRASNAKRKFEKAENKLGDANLQGKINNQQANPQPVYASDMKMPDAGILSESSGLTPSELEANSFSNWNGKFRMYEDNSGIFLLFQLNEGSWISLKANRNPDSLNVGEETYCECSELKDVPHDTKLGQFNGHGIFNRFAFSNRCSRCSLYSKYL
jgi:hypothetical protein